MAEIINMAGWREQKSTVVQAAPAIECPQCEHLSQAVNVEVSGATTYRCIGHGHRALTWRIDVNGDMLRGAVGRRYY